MQHLKMKITYANLMSSLAVFLVLSGATAYAATHLGRNSVGVAQLKAGAVTGAKIRAHAVTGAKIADGTITGSDIAAGSVTGSQIKLDTLPTVPTAESVEGQTNFSFFQTDPVEKQVAQLGPFRVIATCGAGAGHRAGLFLVSEVPVLVSKAGSPTSEHDVGGVELLLDDGTTPGILNDDSQWLVTDFRHGVSLSISHLALGLDVEGHANECFFAGSLALLGEEGS